MYTVNKGLLINSYIAYIKKYIQEGIMKRIRIYVSLLLIFTILVTLPGCSKPAIKDIDQEEHNVNSEDWDREVDICIVGFGLAGAAAAVETYDIDKNASVLVLEKMTKQLAGGNSIASGQTFIVPKKDDLETFMDYMRACNEPNPIPEDYLKWWSSEMADQIGWVVKTMEEVDYEVGYVGGGPLRWGSMVVEFGDLPGSNFEGTSAHIRSKGGPSFETGGVWRGFAKVVENRNIEVLYSTPALELIQDPITKEIQGVLAKTETGELLKIKANKGVVMACGGFENNLEMQRNFHGMDKVYTSGTPGNTGDGIKMLQLAGAQLWHMNNQTQSGGFWLGIKVPDYESSFIRQMTFKTHSWIEVDAEGERFYDEAGSYHRQHMKVKEHGRYIDLPHERALPVDLIFDEDTRQGNVVVTPWLSWSITTEGYVWSNDNQVEIDKGWIIKADTLEELAEKTGRDPVKLKETIDRYNSMVDKGEDLDWGRDITKMSKIEKAPFYSVSLTPALVATTGGAKRDTNSRVLDWDNNPIPNLYSAGELGSFVSNLYQNGIFLSEAILSGRAAVQHILGGKSSVTMDVDTIGEVELKTDIEYVDGVYKAEAEALHGKFTVEAVVKDGRITNVSITDGFENAYMTESQMIQLKSAILAEQTVEVDAISGATLSSTAISDALKDVLKRKD